MNVRSERYNLNVGIAPARYACTLSTTFLAVAFSLFSVLLYLPATLYFANIEEFSLKPNDLALIFLPAWVISVVCGVAIILLLPRAARQHLVSLAFALGLLLWMQGSLLVWQYGPLDGSDIEWPIFWRNGIIDSPIWMLGIAFALTTPSIMIRIGRVTAIIVITIQCLTFLLSTITALANSDGSSARNYAIDTKPKYAFSREQNVILIVLDTYQSDVFREIVSREPKYAAFFEGFTYFPNALAASNYTELAIPALLTGRMYDNTQPREEFLREAYLESGITTRLKRNGFVVDIYPWLGWGNESIYFDEAIASNLTMIDGRDVPSLTFTEKKAKEALHLLDLSFFRTVPHFLKTYIYNDQKWLITHAATYLLPERVKQVVSTDDQFAISTFMAQAPTKLPLNRGRRVLKYFHFKGAHSPLTVDENLDFTPEIFPFNRENYILQAKANLRHLGEFFEKLRSDGIYDSSLILVLGDHGCGESPELYIEAANSGAGSRPNATNRDFRRDKARGIPLVLIKPIGAIGPIQVSDAPVSLRDVPATIIAELNLQISTERPSMFQIDPTSPRVRYYGAFSFSPNKSGFVDPITLYRVDGHSWLDESWTVEKILTPVTSRAEE